MNQLLSVHDLGHQLVQILNVKKTNHRLGRASKVMSVSQPRLPWLTCCLSARIILCGVGPKNSVPRNPIVYQQFSLFKYISKDFKSYFGGTHYWQTHLCSGGGQAELQPQILVEWVAGLSADMLSVGSHWAKRLCTSRWTQHPSVSRGMLWMAFAQLGCWLGVRKRSDGAIYNMCPWLVITPLVLLKNDDMFLGKTVHFSVWWLGGYIIHNCFLRHQISTISFSGSCCLVVSPVFVGDVSICCIILGPIW